MSSWIRAFRICSRQEFTCFCIFALLFSNANNEPADMPNTTNHSQKRSGTTTVRLVIVQHRSIIAHAKQTHAFSKHIPNRMKSLLTVALAHLRRLNS